MTYISSYDMEFSHFEVCDITGDQTRVFNEFARIEDAVDFANKLINDDNMGFKHDHIIIRRVQFVVSAYNEDKQIW